MAMRRKSEMSPPPPPPPPPRCPSDQRDAVIQELRRGAQLAALLRQQVELIPELGRRHAAVANVSDISTALLSSLSVLQSEREHGSSSSSDAGGVLAHAESSARAVDGGVRARSSAVVARTRKARHRRSKDGEELPIKEISTETPQNDRFHWRKYGEKKILDADFPRLYYRCGYSDEHKCPAKKYVQQQNNSNPPLFMVTLINEHTCDTLFPADQAPSSSSKSNSQVLDFTKASISSPTAAPPVGGAGPRLKKEEEEEEQEEAVAMSMVTPSYEYDELSSSLPMMLPQHWDMEMDIKSLFRLDDSGGS